MRRITLGIVAAFAVAQLAAGSGSGPPPAPEAEPVPEDVLFLRTAGGVALVRDLPQGAAVDVPDAVPAIDWSAVVRAVPGEGTTAVEAIDPDSGGVLWTKEVPGTLEVKVASRDAAMVALAEASQGSGYGFGRTTTTFVILEDGVAEPRTIVLDGNYAPEAFSTDGDSLFIVEYLPPGNPTSYRVRRLDLVTEEVVGVYTVDAELQESMQGTARVQAASPDGRRLYTLYTVEGDAGDQRAFVHVLSLDELWAHCIDLPSSFGGTDERAMAIAVNPDGTRLYVADAASGMVAGADTEALAVTRTAEVPFWSRGGVAHAAVGPDGSVALAKGTGVVLVEPSSLAATELAELEGRISGLQMSGDGERLYVGLRDRIVILDTASGARIGEIDPVGVEGIRHLGTSTRSMEEERTTTECAC